MPKANFAMLDTDKLPGGIPLDPIEVLIEGVPQSALNDITDKALSQLRAKAEQIRANAIYAIKREDIRKEGHTTAIYNVKYTAMTCRMVIGDITKAD